jgi:hypothetical protein
MALPAAIGGILIGIASTIAARVIWALGFQVVTFVGLIAAFDWVEAEIKTTLLGMDSTVLAWMGALKVDVALSIIFSALAFRYTLQYLGSDSFRRFVLRTD